MAERQNQLSVVSCSPRFAYETGQLSESHPILGYEPFFDVHAYQNLATQKNLISPQEFSRRKNQLDERTRTNLDTMLGERFNVELSRVTYEIENNHLMSSQHDKPFLEIIRHGQKYRQENGSNDTVRELAEVEGFEKIQAILANPQFEGAKIVIISPRGNKNSIYLHNFFDIYKKRGDRITMCRYTSCATYDQFREIADDLDPFNELPQNPQAADFLSNPLITYKSEGEIIELLKLDLEGMTQPEYQKLIETVAALKLNYINALASGDWYLAQKILIATLNYADAVRAHQRSDLAGGQTSEAAGFDIRSIIGYYSTLPVRPVLAGCGLQTGFSSPFTINNLPLTSSFPYSVAEFATFNLGEDRYGTLEINCEECGASYNRTPGKLEKRCRFCGGTKGITC